MSCGSAAVARVEKGEAWYKAIFPEKANKRKQSKKERLAVFQKKQKRAKNKRFEIVEKRKSNKKTKKNEKSDWPYFKKAKKDQKISDLK